MSVMIRVLVIIVLVVLGFTAVFPQWLDFFTDYNSAERAQTGSVVASQRPTREAVIEPIKLFGRIDKNTRYIAKVTYHTTNESSVCTESGFEGRSPLEKTFEFEPLYDNGEHRIQIPLDSVDSNSTCQWQPRYMETCLERGNDESKQACITLFDAKPNTAIHHPTGRMHLGQEMDGNTINIECNPFDVYESQTPTCYLPRPYDNDFKLPAIMIENRYALTSGQDVEVNFDILSAIEAQERDTILKNLMDLQIEKHKEERRMFEKNKRDQETMIEQARARANKAKGK